VVATAEIDGKIRLFSYTEGSTSEVLAFDHHTESCRNIIFSEDGNYMFSAGKD
jgi:WD40 repeat protein